MAAPLITIGITVYNAAATIERALKSAIAQDWPHLEILAVDDGSSDSSAAFINRIAQQDPHVRLVRHDRNQGCAAARNTVLREAKGEYIAWFDDDDESGPSRLTAQFERIQDYQQSTGASLIACYASGTRLYDNGYQQPIVAIGSQPNIPVGDILAQYLLYFERRSDIFYGSGTPTCALMAHKETYNHVGLFDTKMRRQEDVDYAVRLAHLGGHFIGTADPVLTQHVTTGAEKSADVEQQSFLRLVEKNKDYLVQQGTYHYAIGWSRVRHQHFSGNRLGAVKALLAVGLRHPVKTSGHFLTTAPRRFLHERRMRMS